MDVARKAAIGFVAGGLAVLIFHQAMYYLLGQVGLVQNAPWRMTPAIPPFGVPWLLNLMFWGGLWGVLYALVLEPLIPLPAWAAGILFAIVFPQLLGSWLVVPVIKSQPVFSGFFMHNDPMRLLSGLLLNGLAFGGGLGLVYKSLTSRA